MTHSRAPSQDERQRPSDEELAAAIAAGNTKAFELLFRAHYPGMCGFAARMVSQRDVAEDLVQEVFLYVWRQRDAWQVRTSVKQYLYAALRHGALRYLRHERVVRNRIPETIILFDRAPRLADADLESDETISLVRAAIAKLPERCRLVYTLHREQGLTYAEVAEVMGISAKTVDVQMGRALKSLRRLLADRATTHKSPSNRCRGLASLEYLNSMIEEDDICRLARYFADECTDDERRATESWLAEDPGRCAEAERLRVLWRVSGYPSWTPNTDAAWASLTARFHVGEAQVPLTLVSSVAPHQPHKFQWRHAPTRRIARPILGVAALLAASIIAFVMGREQESDDRAVRAKPAETPAREFRTARGQRAVVVLGDGSRVELGAESVLRVRESSTGRRVVLLDGQAVFEVVHDSLRPFEVQSGNAITQDLGTRLTVRAYRDESRVQVFVASGKVALRAVGSPASSGTLLGPNDLGVLDSVGRTTVRNGVDSTSHLAWTRDRFVFDNAILADVLSDIARWFDVKIEVAVPELLKHRITMNVPARSLSEVVGAVTTPLRLRFTKRGSTIVIQ